eukprot:833782-Amphidinium_carterae.2
MDWGAFLTRKNAGLVGLVGPGCVNDPMKHDMNFIVSFLDYAGQLVSAQLDGGMPPPDLGAGDR